MAAFVYATVTLIGAKPQKVILPGGVELSFIAMTTGTIEYFVGGFIDKFVWRFFPRKTIGIGKLKYQAEPPLRGRPHTDQSDGIVWLRDFSTRANKPFPFGNEVRLTMVSNTRATIIDEEGEEWESP
jgi:hypothetical protein